jgi:membrane protease YdiL (CAAX protease family)
MWNSTLSNNKAWECPDHATRKIQFVEVIVFLFLIVPSLVLSFFVAQQGGEEVNFPFLAVATIVRDLSLLSLIFYFVWRNREGLHSLGWSFGQGWREIFFGLVLFWPVFYTASLLDDALRRLGFSAPTSAMSALEHVRGTGEIILAFIMVCVVAVAEETIFRGYLLLRFQKGLQMAPFTAALISAVIFSLGHGYEGTSGVVTVGYIGLCFALVYQWRGSLVAPMIMHFLQDFAGIVLGPLLGIK